MFQNTSLIVKNVERRIHKGLYDIWNVWWDCKTLLDGEMMPHEPQLYELTRKVWILQMSIQGHYKSALNSDTSDETKS